MDFRNSLLLSLAFCGLYCTAAEVCYVKNKCTLVTVRCCHLLLVVYIAQPLLDFPRSCMSLHVYSWNFLLTLVV
jgi:hypothetical protein